MKFSTADGTGRILTHIRTSIHPYKRTYIQMCLHTYIDTYKCAYIHTYIHTCINTCVYLTNPNSIFCQIPSNWKSHSNYCLLRGRISCLTHLSIIRSNTTITPLSLLTFKALLAAICSAPRRIM